MDTNSDLQFGISSCRAVRCPGFKVEDGKAAAKDLDPVETERELARIGKGLEALAAGEQVEFDLVAAERDQERIGKGIKVLLARQEAARII